MGVEAVPVEVEVDLLRRLPCIAMVGLPSASVREAADRVRSAVLAAGFEFNEFGIRGHEFDPRALPKSRALWVEDCLHHVCHCFVGVGTDAGLSRRTRSGVSSVNGE